MADDADLAAELAGGMRFANTMGEETRRGVYETALTVLALVEELRERGAIDDAEHGRRVAEAEAAEVERVKQHVRVMIDNRDKYAIGAGPDVPCAELMHLCRGRCCTLHFPLSKQDLNERVIRWQYARPYLIRQRADDGYCVHNDPVTHGCTVYTQRPATCRSYDCRKDKRIWADYEKRIPTIDPRLSTREAPVPFGPPPE